MRAKPGENFSRPVFSLSTTAVETSRQWTLVGWKSRKKLSRIVLHIFWWYRIKYGFVFRLVDLIPRFLLACFNINNIPYCCILSFLSGEENQSIENSFTIILNWNYYIILYNKEKKMITLVNELISIRENN